MFVFSFGWVLAGLLLGTLIVCGNYLLINGLRRNDSYAIGGGIFSMFATIFIASLIIGSENYVANVELPNKLACAEAKIANIKTLLGSNDLESIQVKRDLITYIAEREDVLMSIRNRNSNPITLFRTKI